MKKLNSINRETQLKEQIIGNFPQHSSVENNFGNIVVKKESEHFKWEAITDEALYHSISASNNIRYQNDDLRELQCKREAIESPMDFVPLETYPQLPITTNDFKSSETLFTKNMQPLVVEDKSSLSSFRFMNFKAKIGICAANYPKVKLTQKQIMALQLVLEKEILTPEGLQVKPRFFGLRVTDGCLMLTCGDMSTIAWVKSLVGKMEKKIERRLVLVDYMPTEKTFIAVGYFSKSQDHSNATVLNYLKVQNSGLDVSKWRVLDRISEKKERGIRLTLSIDWESADLIRRKGPKLNYKLGMAKFVIVSERGLQFNEEDDDKDEDEDENDDRSSPMQFLNPRIISDLMPVVQNEFLLSRPYLTSLVPPPSNLTSGDNNSANIAMGELSKINLTNGKTAKERNKRRKKLAKKKKKKQKITESGACPQLTQNPSNLNE